MEYILYAFGDDSNIENLLAYLSSAREFENALISYEQPIIQTRGGILGICEKRYTLSCPFDLNLFNVLDRLQKLDLYEYAREFIHKNASKGKHLIHLLEQASRLRSEPNTILLFFTQLKNEFERIARNFVYLYLHNIDINHVSLAFQACHSAINTLESDITNMLHDLQSSTTKLHSKKYNAYDQETPQKPSPRPRRDNKSVEATNSGTDDDDNVRYYNAAANNRRTKIRPPRLCQRSDPYKTRN